MAHLEAETEQVELSDAEWQDRIESGLESAEIEETETLTTEAQPVTTELHLDHPKVHPIKANTICFFCKRPFSEELPKKSYIYPIAGEDVTVGGSACVECYPEAHAASVKAGLIIKFKGSTESPPEPIKTKTPKRQSLGAAVARKTSRAGVDKINHPRHLAAGIIKEGCTLCAGMVATGG
jgi:hypothetical protein